MKPDGRQRKQLPLTRITSYPRQTLRQIWVRGPMRAVMILSGPVIVVIHSLPIPDQPRLIPGPITFMLKLPIPIIRTKPRFLNPVISAVPMLEVLAFTITCTVRIWGVYLSKRTTAVRGIMCGIRPVSSIAVRITPGPKPR